MGNFYTFIKRTPKNIFFIFVAILLISAMCISCTTTSDEGINDKEVIEESVHDDENEEVLVDEETAEEIAKPTSFNTYQEKNYPELRIAYEETTILLPEDMEIPKEVYIVEWNLARIIIPKIDVDLIVLGGVDVFDRENLSKGPVYFGESLDKVPEYRGSLPNTESGNVAIGGHRSEDRFGNRYDYFLDLDFLEEGDEIFLDIEGYRFIYLVQWQEIVDRFNWSCLATTDYPALTLQTCEPKESDPNPEYRLMIRADLHEVMRTPKLD